jgi:hypothetical protein
MSIRKSQIRLVVDEVRAKQGEVAVEAIFRQVGAANLDSINVADYPKVLRLCGYAELADAAKANTEAKAEPRELSDFERVVHGAPDIKTGFDRAAIATHARRNAR